ncbi:MAG: hypothetical protein NC930_04725 [Candidatus Omnitrophica bacterium]|nr:hypothetical protein [Candidatus Omnitrophota bacterium]
MKKIFALCLLVFGVYGGYPLSSAQALIYVDTIVFPQPTVAIDKQTGNTIDFAYSHTLSSIDPTSSSILSGSLSLTHMGNLNLGPAQEIWLLLTAGGIPLGLLSESELVRKTDTWQFPGEILHEIMSSNPWSLNLALSEQTSYNSEKLELFESTLDIEYQNTLPPPPTIPEPATLLTMLPGLLCFSILKKKGGRQAS